MSSESAKIQLESIGHWFVGAVTAIPEWGMEYDSMRDLLHALADDYLDNGGDCSDELLAKPLAEVIADIKKDVDDD